MSCPKSKKTSSECAPYVDQGRVSKTTEDAAKKAAAVVEIYKKYYGEPLTLEMPAIVFSVRPVPSPEGELDPRRKPKLPFPEDIGIGLSPPDTEEKPDSHDPAPDSTEEGSDKPASGDDAPKETEGSTPGGADDAAGDEDSDEVPGDNPAPDDA